MIMRANTCLKPISATMVLPVLQKKTGGGHSRPYLPDGVFRKKVSSTAAEKVNNLKLRASWGKLGNQEILDSDGNPSYYPTVSTMSLGYDYALGGSLASGGLTYYAVILT